MGELISGSSEGKRKRKSNGWEGIEKGMRAGRRDKEQREMGELNGAQRK